jgi:hypothetical protein
MSLDLDLTFPIRDVPSANLMRLKATCLWNAGIIDDGERELVQQRAERFLRRAKANAALWAISLAPQSPLSFTPRRLTAATGGHKSLCPRALPAGFIAPCLPSPVPQPPSGELWLHEIKHDGFRVIARKNGARVKLYSRPGNDLTKRFPLIVDALASLASSTGRPSRAGRTALLTFILSVTGAMMRRVHVGVRPD